MDLLQFKNKFIEDANELLNKLDDVLIQMEKNPDNSEYVEQVFRVMHTLKGTAGMYGFDAVTEITHQLESVFNLVRDGLLVCDTELFTITLATVDHIRNLLIDENLSDNQNERMHKNLLEKVQNILKENNISNPIETKTQKKNFSETKFRTWQIHFFPSEELINRSINILYTFEDLLKLGEYRINEPNNEDNILFWSIILVTDKPQWEIEDALIFIMDFCKINLIAEFDIFKPEEIANRIKSLSETVIEDNVTEIDKTQSDIQLQTNVIKIETRISSKINVDASKLDYLMYLVSELVITNSELFLSIKHKSDKRILESALKVDKISKLFRDNALSIRLISLQETISRFNKLIRDLSVSLNKKVEFEVIGAEIELDKNIIDSIAEPIMHLMRNCIDHGIETPDERIQANKPETGMVKLFAYKYGNFVFIQISDDGKGIDKDKVRKKAIDKGIINADTQLTDKELYDLIFLPGFSTAESLTQVSGRGVGMDIVKKKISELRGEIEITSETGLGTSFTIKLHQTIAILDTLLFQIDDLFMLLPISDVENCSLIDRKILDEHFGTISYNNQLIPYIDLYSVFQLNKSTQGKGKLIVINRQEKLFVIAVDTIIGEHQAVLKSFDTQLIHQNKFAGASIMGDGNLAYLLDLTAIQSNNN